MVNLLWPQNVDERSVAKKEGLYCRCVVILENSLIFSDNLVRRKEGTMFP